MPTAFAETDIIDILSARFASMPLHGMEGIGDDCAVVPISETESLVISTDMLAEGSHFLPAKISPRQLGYKALAVNVSDLAAMGAVPLASFLSIAADGRIGREWTEAFASGYRELSDTCSMPLLGGDTIASEKGITLNITVIGKVRNDRIKRRNGAVAGDGIFVLDYLGESAAGLQAILDGTETDSPARARLAERHRMPRLFIQEGIFLGQWPQVHALTDISDGIAKDLRQILHLSGTGADVETARIPISEATRSVCCEDGRDALHTALTGGEDYTLLFTTDMETYAELENAFRKRFGYAPFFIGRITPQGNGLRWLDAGGKPETTDYRGFTHDIK